MRRLEPELSMREFIRASTQWPQIDALDTGQTGGFDLCIRKCNYLRHILAQTGGDKDKTAELLGISLATVYRKLAEHES